LGHPGNSSNNKYPVNPEEVFAEIAFILLVGLLILKSEKYATILLWGALEVD